jgi:hypothetical protein
MHEILERLESELATVLHGLDARQAQLTPKLHPEKWNIQQIVEHLLLSYRSTTVVLQTRIDKGSATKARPVPQQRFAQFFLIALGRFPRGRLAPPEVSPTLPASLRNGEELTRRVHDDLAGMERAACAAEALFGTGRCASHMILGPLSIHQWRRFHLIHGQHHIKQIRRIRQDHYA